MWRRPTESGISFICILAPTRFFVKSIKINIARRGLKISSPTSFFSPLSSFWQAKNSLLSLPHSSGNPGCSKKKCTPRGAFFFIFSRNLISSEAMKAHSGLTDLPRTENFFTRKFLQPAFEFSQGKTRLYSFLTGSGNPGSSRHKKKRPAGRFF